MVTKVRISISPPHSLSRREIRLHCSKNRSKSPQFRRSSIQTALEKSVPSNPGGKFSGAFLWKAQAQSGFSNSVGRMQCDHKPIVWRKRLDFAGVWGMHRVKSDRPQGCIITPDLRFCPLGKCRSCMARLPNELIRARPNAFMKPMQPFWLIWSSRVVR